MKIDWEKLGLEPPASPDLEISTGKDSHRPDYLHITFFKNCPGVVDSLQEICAQYGWRMTMNQDNQGLSINCVGTQSANAGNAIGAALQAEGLTVRLHQMIPNRHGVFRSTVVEQLISLPDN